MRATRVTSTAKVSIAVVARCTCFGVIIAACASMSDATSAYAWSGDAGNFSDAFSALPSAFSRVNSLCSSIATASQSCNPDAPLACGNDASSERCAVVNNAPVCVLAGAQTLGKGCRESSECSAGLSCVYTRSSAATCRPTCCVDACRGAGGAGDAGSASLYCTLAVEARRSGLPDAGTWSAARLPACVVTEPCVYGGASSCGTARSCEPVGGGRTSCVELGPRKAGESCARELCEQGSACVGQGGERTCLALCSQRNPVCAAGERCVRSVVVAEDLDVGYCIDPNVDRPRLF